MAKSPSPRREFRLSLRRRWFRAPLLVLQVRYVPSISFFALTPGAAWEDAGVTDLPLNFAELLASTDA